MKVHLLVQREAGDTSDYPGCWVTDAIDEYSLEEWNGQYPDAMQAKIDAEPVNLRILIVEIPDDALPALFRAPTVTGTVTQ